MPIKPSLWPLLGVLLLAGCFGGDDFWMGGGGPVPVYFPDDHRVLHDDWQIWPNRAGEAPRHAMAGDGQAIMVWAHARNPLHLGDGEGGFQSHEPAIDFGDFRDGQFDRHRDTLVSFILPDHPQLPRSLTVRQRPMTGGAISELRLSMPTGRLALEGYAVQGQLLVLSEDEEGQRRLEDFDPGDGRHLGSRPLPHGPLGLRNGSDRAIGFLDYLAERLHVVDTRQPERILSFSRSACGAQTETDLSQSGRWLMVVGCGSDVYLLDLEQAEPTLLRLPWVDHRAGPTFAHEADEIVWYGLDGHIGRLDLASGARIDIPLDAAQLAFSEEDWRLSPVWYADLGLLVYQEGRNRLLVARIEDGQIASWQILPRLWLERGELSLVASDLSEDGMSYRVTGELVTESQTFGIEGTVVSDRVHFYRPSPGTQLSIAQPIAQPPSQQRQLVFEASLSDETGQHVLDLRAVAYSHFDTIWSVVVTDQLGDQTDMTLSRY